MSTCQKQEIDLVVNGPIKAGMIDRIADRIAARRPSKKKQIKVTTNQDETLAAL